MKKRPGQIPDLRRTPIRKLVKFNNKSAVMTIDETDFSYTIYIGNPEIYCIDAHISKENYSDSPETGQIACTATRNRSRRCSGLSFFGSSPRENPTKATVTANAKNLLKPRIIMTSR